MLLAVSMEGQQNLAESTGNSVFRIAHQSGANAGCILVKKQGTFHSERVHGRTTEVLEGTLSPESLASLNALLGDSRFRELLSEAVSTPPLPSGLDEVVISVPDGRRWLTLRFITGMSGTRNQVLIDNFLKWENRALKSAQKKRLDEPTRDNCVLLGPIELKTRPIP